MSALDLVRRGPVRRPQNTWRIRGAGRVAGAPVGKFGAGRLGDVAAASPFHPPWFGRVGHFGQPRVVASAAQAQDKAKIALGETTYNTY